MKTISMVCPSCGAEMEVSEEKLLLYCPYCGKKLQLDIPHMDEVFKEKEKTKRAKERTERIRVEHEYKERVRQREHEEAKENEKTGWKMLLLLALLWAFIYFGYEAVNFVHRSKGDVKAPISSSGQVLKDLDYEDVEIMFVSEGFENIELINKHDLVIGLIKKENTVESISINGETNFSKGNWFPADAIVRIVYHGF